MFEGAKKLPSNVGWRCGHCRYGIVRKKDVHGAAVEIREHIKKDHPERWKDESWMMVAVRRKGR